MKTTSLFTLFVLGFIFVSTGVKADKSIAECTPGKDSNDCGSDMQCMKGVGDEHYHCGCKPGYAMHKESCRDVDECKMNEYKEFRLRCKSVGGNCKNTRGFFECACRQGFQMHPSKQICQDQDECEDLKTCHEKATCHNTRGSYRCKCKEGFAGDGKECIEDIAYNHERDKELIIMVGCAAGGGVLLIIALISFCCCARKRKKEEKEESFEKLDSTLSHYGNDWESSEDSEESA